VSGLAAGGGAGGGVHLAFAASRFRRKIRIFSADLASCGMHASWADTTDPERKEEMASAAALRPRRRAPSSARSPSWSPTLGRTPQRMSTVQQSAWSLAAAECSAVVVCVCLCMCNVSLVEA